MTSAWSMRAARCNRESPLKFFSYKSPPLRAMSLTRSYRPNLTAIMSGVSPPNVLWNMSAPCLMRYFAYLFFLPISDLCSIEFPSSSYALRSAPLSTRYPNILSAFSSRASIKGVNPLYVFRSIAFSTCLPTNYLASCLSVSTRMVLKVTMWSENTHECRGSIFFLFCNKHDAWC